jgi:hypothetical protein
MRPLKFSLYNLLHVFAMDYDTLSKLSVSSINVEIVFWSYLLWMRAAVGGSLICEVISFPKHDGLNIRMVHNVEDMKSKQSSSAHATCEPSILPSCSRVLRDNEK